MGHALIATALFAPLLALAAPPAPPPLLDALPATVRMLLKPRMKRHIRDLGALRAAVRQQRWVQVAERARAIADEPTIARPVPGTDDALNTQLPERFFALQDELRHRAEALHQAARTGQAEASQRAFDDLSLTCLRCHGHYGPPPHLPDFKTTGVSK